MLSDTTLRVLNECKVNSDSFTVTIQGDLGRALYEDVNEVLTRLGGKWNKKAKAHLFPYDPAPLVNAVIDSRQMPPKNPTAFFPTPKPIVDSMIEISRLWNNSCARILEPSAGTGAIAEAIREHAPDATLHVCEFLDVNRSVLASKGFQIVANDFMEYQPDEPYDYILMNPPFSLDGDKYAYVTHIMRAWELLADHGQLVAIVPPGWIDACKNTKLNQFADFVCDYLDFTEIGAGAFKESGTMVNTYIIHGQKDSEPWTRKKYNGWNSYHAWHMSLWLDNDYKLYTAIQQCKTREEFDALCASAVRDMRRQAISVTLRTPDIDELWNYYQEHYE